MLLMQSKGIQIILLGSKHLVAHSVGVKTNSYNICMYISYICSIYIIYVYIYFIYTYVCNMCIYLSMYFYCFRYCFTCIIDLW